MKQPGLVFIGLSGLVLLTAGCVSQSKFENVVKKNDQLEKQNRALQSKMKYSENEKTIVKQNLETTTAALTETSSQLEATKAQAERNAKLYNKLVSKLSSEINDKEITIKQMQSGLTVNLPEGILFDSGSANLSKKGELVLHKVAKELWDVPYQTIVGGFTDNVAVSKRLAKQFPSNWDLSAARATNVVRLLQDSGVPKNRLIAVAFGENQPIASNDTDEGRAQNRRIEIRLRPVLIGNEQPESKQ